MDYYSAIKNDEFMKFLGKWMDLENIILSEVTQSQKNTHGMHSIRSLEYPIYIDQMKLKKKEDQSVDALVHLRKGNKIFMGTNTETKCGAETEGKAIQRLSHLGIHPIYSYQTQALLWMPGSAC